jgi:O-antigen ligase
MRSVVQRTFSRSNIPVVIAAFLIAAVLWKGGKTLEMTWVLVALAWLCAADQWSVGFQPKRPVPALLWLLLCGYVGMSVASAFTSQTANYGLDEMLRTGALVTLCLWMIRVAQESALQRFRGALIAATIVACAVGILVYVLQPVDRMVGTFLDFRFHTDYWPNAWAEFLLLVWPVLLVWSWQTLRSTPIRLVTLALVLACLLLSYSRASILVFAAQAGGWIVFVLLSDLHNRTWLKPALSKALAVTVLALVLFVGINAVRSRIFPVQSVTEKVTFTAAEGTSSVSERSQFWQQALRMTAQKPLLGWGPYSFRFVQPRMQEGVLATSDHPHNVFLKLASERGIPAMLFFAGAVIVILWCAAQSVRSTPWSTDAAMFLGVAGVLAHNLVDYNLQFVGIALPFWLFLGALGRLVPVSSYSVPMRFQRIAEVVLITVLMLTAIVEGRYLALSSLGRHAQAAGDTEAALEWYERSSAQRFSRDLHLSRAQLFIEKGDYAKATEVLNVYAAQNEEDGRLWKLRGDLCTAQNDAACARTTYERAYVLYGWNDLSILRFLVESMIAADGKESVDLQKEEFTGRMRAFANAIERNAHFIALSHNVEELMLLTKRFAALYPEEEPAYLVLGAAAARNAESERSRLQTRSPGVLW